MKRHLKAILIWVGFAVLISILILAMGESPLNIFKIFVDSSMGSLDNFSYTLFYATPLLLTGTAVTLALRAGLFNIGAEGQLYFGAMGAAIVAFFISKHFEGLPLQNSHWFSSFLYWALGFFVSFLFGGFWGFIVGYLKAYRNTHEVISSIMLNFTAFALSNWLILNPLKNQETQSLETIWLPEFLRINKFYLQVSPFFFVCLLISLVTLFFIDRTWGGFKLRAVGENPIAAKIAGISSKKITLLVMFFSGGISGLVGFNEVFCSSYRLLDSFSPGFGFTGLAIALLSQGKPIRFILSCLLFAALYKGTLDLDIETQNITRDFAGVIQALILFGLAITLSLRKQTS